MGSVAIAGTIVLAAGQPQQPGGRVLDVAFNQPQPLGPATQPIALMPAVPPGAQILEQRFDGKIRPLLTQYCFGCHGNGKHKGDVTLDKFISLAAVQEGRETWQDICDELSQGDMPPDDKPQPGKAEVQAITGWVHEALTFRDRNAPRDPGRVTIHRLNKTEYNNTIRDLIGVDFHPADDFPADDTGYGFDNIADVLSMSPLLAEKYLSAANDILDKAILTPGPARKTVVKFPVDKLEPSHDTANAKLGAPGWILYTPGSVGTRIELPVGGEYEIRVKAMGDQAGGEPVGMAIKLDGEMLRKFDVPNSRDNPQAYPVRATAQFGSHNLAIAFTNPPPDRSVKRRLIVDSVEVEGPFSTKPLPLPPPSELQKRIIFCMPGKDGTEEQCAKKILEHFAARAFRRPVPADEAETIVKLFRISRQQGDGFEKSIKFACSAVLVSPQFLYRIEMDPAANHQKTAPITDYELATRLSYFLWSSMPDDELFSLAGAGRLRQPGVIEQQIKRMLASSKANTLIDDFGGQWLELRNLDDVSPDASKFPNFDGRLRAAMKKEFELFFAGIIHEDRSVLDFLDADYTYANERLAKYYGISGVTGDEFRKVSLAGTHRGGVLTMGGVLTVISMPTRTSPARRGKFVLDQILGTPPPPPPPDVPSFKANAFLGKSMTLRQRFELHRADPTCASCHKRMDPIGFAMENFDAVGAWRTMDGGLPIDANATLPGNIQINGPDSLRQLLLAKKDQFVRSLVEKMITYGLGRGIDPSDRATVDDICDDVAAHGYRFSSMIESIVKSDAFQKRRTNAADAVAISTDAIRK